ncbi:MAG: ESX-1 secretion-associated protein [Mycobacterium sp.]
MTNEIRVVPEELRLAAQRHRATADELMSASKTHRDIMASLDSLGPIFGELRAAGQELLELRRACYERQAAAHSDLADNLHLAAATWESSDSIAAQELRDVAE